jgi:alcohol dehydrogenase class IV
MDPKSLTRNWNYPTAIRFGPGRIAELPAVCKELGMKRPLLVTDPGLRKLPMIDAALAALNSAGLGTATFSDIRANPVGKNVDDGVACYKAGQCDGVIAFGGGSALDVGKTIALMSGQTRPLWDFEDRDDWYTRVNPAGVAQTIAVPTTAGTGSEVGRASVILDEATHIKKIIFHPKMLPSVVISDPELTLGLPPRITAATGMDALAHCLEAYCAPGFHPLADGIAIEGIRLVKEWLPIAVKDGNNIAARAHMLAAASMGATAFQKGLGAIHSLSHPVGAIYNSHHGETNAVVMPYVLQFNRAAIEERITRLARYLGLSNASFRGFLDWVLSLRSEIGIPNTLADLGVKESDLDRLVPMAVDDPSTGGNPRPAGHAEMRQMFLMAIHGDLFPATAVTETEKRKQGRLAINRQPAGKMIIHIAEERCPVMAVNDISPSGVSFLVDRRVAVQSQVSIEYKDSEVNLELNGIVTWCTARDDSDNSQGLAGSHLVGVELLSPLLFISLIQQGS